MKSDELMFSNKESEENTTLINEKIFDEIKRDFEKRRFNFNNLKKEDYYYSLISYLKLNGYGYAAKNIYNCRDDIKNNDYEEVCKILIDSCLIDKIDRNLEFSIDDGTCITYNVYDGLKKELYIKNDNDKFKIVKINSVNNLEKDFVKCRIKENKISIYINIPADRWISFKELIIVRTNYGIAKFKFSVKAEKKGKYAGIDELISSYKAEKISKQEAKVKYKEIIEKVNNEDYTSNTNKIAIDFVNKILDSYKSKENIEVLCNLNDVYDLPKEDVKVRKKEEKNNEKLNIPKLNDNFEEEKENKAEEKGFKGFVKIVKKLWNKNKENKTKKEKSLIKKFLGKNN